MITTGQATVTGSASAFLTMPAGPCTVLLSNAGTSTPVWVGALVTGGTLASTNGWPVPSGQSPVAIPGYAGGGGARLAAVTSGGTATLGWLLSTSTGGTGL